MLGEFGKDGVLGELGKEGVLGELGKEGVLGELGKVGVLGELGKEGVLGELGKEGVLGELLDVDDLVMMSETTEGLRNKFVKWKEAFESKGLKVNLVKTKVAVSDGMSMSKVYPCGVCSLRVRSYSVLCVQCGKWIHGRCAGVVRVTPMFSQSFTCSKCEGNIGEVLEQGETLCDEVQIVRESTYLGDRVSVGGGCEAAVAAIARCGWVKLRECNALLFGRRLPLRQKGAVYRSYVWPAILYEVWSTAERQKKISSLDVHARFEGNCGSAGYGK